LSCIVLGCAADGYFGAGKGPDTNAGNGNVRLVGHLHHRGDGRYTFIPEYVARINTGYRWDFNDADPTNRVNNWN